MGSIANPDTPHSSLLVERPRLNAAVGLYFHRYLPVAACYFFFNAAGLPIGLFYTSIFSPLLYLWLYLEGRRWLTTKFLLLLSPFILVHMVIGIAFPLYYLRSVLLFWTAYVAVYAFCWGLWKSGNVERLFDQLILLNFCATILALALRPTPLRSLLWNDYPYILLETSHVIRLNLLNTEPSAYAELMLPLLIFAAIRLLQDNRMRNIVYFVMIGFPLLLSQSFGGFSMSCAGIGIALIISYRRFLMRPRSLIIFACLAIAVGIFLLIPNPISERVMQVATGGDTSTKSRTIFSFIIAYAVASPKSLWWGAGLGQAKFVDVSGLGIGFDVAVIPNAVAGTLAEFGIIGVVFRLAVEFYLFFKTRVYLNSFRLAMFVVAFITQLTGSYVPDVQQYLLWLLAYAPIFPNLNLRPSGKPDGSRLLIKKEM